MWKIVEQDYTCRAGCPDSPDGFLGMCQDTQFFPHLVQCQRFGTVKTAFSESALGTAYYFKAILYLLGACGVIVG
jgi:hypothetical protein